MNTTNTPKRPITAEDIERAAPELRPKLVAQLCDDFVAGLRRMVEHALLYASRAASRAEASEASAPPAPVNAVAAAAPAPSSTPPPGPPADHHHVDAAPPKPEMPADSGGAAREHESAEQPMDVNAICGRLRSWFDSLVRSCSPAVKRQEVREEAPMSTHPILDVLGTILASLSPQNLQPSEPIAQV